MKLDVTGLTVRYGAERVLENVTFNLDPGDMVAVLGPNGAGKSTLLKAVSGHIAYSGRIRMHRGRMNGSAARGSAARWNGRPPGAHGQRNGRSTVAYLPQDGLARVGLTVLEAVLLGRHESLGWRVSDRDLREAGEKLERLGIAHLNQRTLNTLSGGQRQLAGLAQALFRGPEILLLDEPTSALDLHRQMLVLDDLKALAREDGLTVVMVMHDLSLAARFAERILFLKDGRLVADDRSESVLTSDMVGRVYNIEAEILRGRSGLLHVAPVRPLDMTAGRSEA